MGFEIQRFVDEDIDQEFICNICHDVLEDPLMIANCQHLFCSKCIRDCIKVHGVCPQDRSPVSITKLCEPIRIIKNLLNKLKIRCKTSVGGCDLILPLGELHIHLDKCEANPENKKVKCFCKNDFTAKELDEHQKSCLEFLKNDLAVTKAQLSTYSHILYGINESLAEKVIVDSEIKFLYKRLKQRLPNSTDDYNTIQRSLIYLNSKLLNHEIETEKDVLSTIRYVKYAFEDLAMATEDGYDHCYDFVAHNGIDYLILCENLLKNKHINRFIAMIMKNMSKYEDFLTHMMNRKCIRMLLNLMSEKTEIQICVNSGSVLSDIVLLGSELWERFLSDYNRQTILNEFRLNVFKWKSDQKSELKYESLKELFDKLKSDKTTPEVNAFHIWILSHLIREDVEKYAPMIVGQNGIDFLQSLFESSTTVRLCQRDLEFVINKCKDWKNRQEID